MSPPFPARGAPDRPPAAPRAPRGAGRTRSASRRCHQRPRRARSRAQSAPGAGKGDSPALCGSRGPTPGRVGAVPPRRGRREGGAAGAARGRVTHAVISAARARRQRRAGGGTAGPHKGRLRARLPHSPRTAEADWPVLLRKGREAPRRPGSAGGTVPGLPETRRSVLPARRCCSRGRLRLRRRRAGEAAAGAGQKTRGTERGAALPSHSRSPRHRRRAPAMGKPTPPLQ